MLLVFFFFLQLLPQLKNFFFSLYFNLVLQHALCVLLPGERLSDTPFLANLSLIIVTKASIIHAGTAHFALSILP